MYGPEDNEDMDDFDDYDEDDDDEDFDDCDESMDGDFDSGMSSAGHGMDEDYNGWNE